jgi:hypothetical protein
MKDVRVSGGIIQAGHNGKTVLLRLTGVVEVGEPFCVVHVMEPDVADKIGRDLIENAKEARKASQ